MSLYWSRFPSNSFLLAIIEFLLVTPCNFATNFVLVAVAKRPFNKSLSFLVSANFFGVCKLLSHFADESSFVLLSHVYILILIG